MATINATTLPTSLIVLTQLTDFAFDGLIVLIIDLCVEMLQFLQYVSKSMQFIVHHQFPPNPTFGQASIRFFSCFLDLPG
jgi:hypothetical protein